MTTEGSVPREPQTLTDVARATPASRDRYVDFLRAFSILVVMFGHWLMAVVTYRSGQFAGQNALESIPNLWVLTWVLQVMPLFFFVGGFSNFRTVNSLNRSGTGYAGYLQTRVSRLLAPTLVFVVAWLLITPALKFLFDIPGDMFSLLTRVVSVPLWFLAVYIVVVALAPVMLKLHLRYRWGVLVVLALAAVLGDGCRTAIDVPPLAVANFAWVWLFVHQLGFFYADETLSRFRPRDHLLMMLGGLAALFVLTHIDVYSPSMVGVNDGLESNNSPPSVCILALSVWLVGLAMLLRPRISAWLQGVGSWSAVIAVNQRIMTIYLWHLTTLVVAAPLLYLAGWPQPDIGTPGWWLLRIPWILVLVVALIPFVLLFGRFERPRPREKTESADSPIGAVISAAAGAAFISLGLIGFALSGFDSSFFDGGFDFRIGSTPLNAVLLFAGAALCTGPRVGSAR
jgi:peptidoglycan/LPS O-acetylase OafA/YrhL